MLVPSTPAPERNASVSLGSSRKSEAMTSKRPSMEAGPPSSARAIPGLPHGITPVGRVIGDIPRGGLGGQPFPDVGSAVPVRWASSTDVIGPAPARALYRPSLSPISTSTPDMAAPTSPSILAMNSSSWFGDNV